VIGGCSEIISCDATYNKFLNGDKIAALTGDRNRLVHALVGNGASEDALDPNQWSGPARLVTRQALPQLLDDPNGVWEETIVFVGSMIPDWKDRALFHRVRFTVVTKAGRKQVEGYSVMRGGVAATCTVPGRQGERCTLSYACRAMTGATVGALV